MESKGCAVDQENAAVFAFMQSVVDQCQQSLTTCESSGLLAGIASIGEDGFPYFTLAVLMLGCGCILNLFYKEYIVYCKIASSFERSTSVGEYLLSRLDFYFSSSQWARPLLLLTITFILIVVAAIVHMIILGDSVSAAMWKAWTYVADPGSSSETRIILSAHSALVTTLNGL
jgi:hypothetical protein